MTTICANHPGNPATAFCRTCGKPLCEECKREVRGVIYCEECIAARLEGTMPAGAGAAPPPPQGAYPGGYAVADDNPSVGLATVLGFIPGVGAMYNGQFAKAVAHIIIFITLANLADRAESFGILVAAFMFFMVFDANKTAKARRYGQPLPDYLGLSTLFGGAGSAPGAKAAMGTAWQKAESTLDHASNPQRAVPVVSLILIGLGGLLLLHNLGFFSLQWVNTVIGPVALIAAGMFLGARRWQRAGD